MKLVAVLLVCVYLMAVPGTASAHVLQADHGISVVLHIPPDDNAVAGRETRLDFAFSSDAGKFSLQNCDCSVKVTADDQPVQTVPIASAFSDIRSGEARVTFPRIGVYDVVVTGHAQDNSFEDFRLDFVERVETSATAAKPRKNSSLVLAVSITSFTLLTGIAYVLIRRGGRYSKPV